MKLYVNVALGITTYGCRIWPSERGIKFISQVLAIFSVAV